MSNIVLDSLPYAAEGTLLIITKELPDRLQH